MHAILSSVAFFRATIRDARYSSFCQFFVFLDVLESSCFATGPLRVAYLAERFSSIWTGHHRIPWWLGSAVREPALVIDFSIGYHLVLGVSPQGVFLPGFISTASLFIGHYLSLLFKSIAYHQRVSVINRWAQSPIRFESPLEATVIRYFVILRRKFLFFAYDHFRLQCTIFRGPRSFFLIHPAFLFLT